MSVLLSEGKLRDLAQKAREQTHQHETGWQLRTYEEGEETSGEEEVECRNDGLAHATPLKESHKNRQARSSQPRTSLAVQKLSSSANGNALEKLRDPGQRERLQMLQKRMSDLDTRKAMEFVHAIDTWEFDIHELNELVPEPLKFVAYAVLEKHFK